MLPLPASVLKRAARRAKSADGSGRRTKGAFGTPPIIDGSGWMERESDIMPPEPTGPRFAAPCLWSAPASIDQLPVPSAVMHPGPADRHRPLDHRVKAAPNPDRRVDMKDEEQDRDD